MWGLTTWTTIGSVEPWTASPARRRALIDEISASSANSAPLALSSIMWTYCSIAPRPQYGVFPMHHATHSSSQPRRTASSDVGVLDPHGVGPRRAARLAPAASTPGATCPRRAGPRPPRCAGRPRRSWSTKSATLKVPVSPSTRGSRRSRSRGAGTPCSTSPSASPKAGQVPGPAQVVAHGSGETEVASDVEVRQRRPISAGLQSPTAACRVMMPPEVPSTWWNARPCLVEGPHDARLPGDAHARRRPAPGTASCRHPPRGAVVPPHAATAGRRRCSAVSRSNTATASPPAVEVGDEAGQHGHGRADLLQAHQNSATGGGLGQQRLQREPAEQQHEHARRWRRCRRRVGGRSAPSRCRIVPGERPARAARRRP